MGIKSLELKLQVVDGLGEFALPEDLLLETRGEICSALLELGRDKVGITEQCLVIFRLDELSQPVLEPFCLFAMCLSVPLFFLADQVKLVLVISLPRHQSIINRSVCSIYRCSYE